jgi:hypothetical protein
LTVAVTAALMVTATGARAHEDPAGCFETGVSIVVTVLRADGTTGVVGSVSECETINYTARLAKGEELSNDICAFSGGTFSITLPNGTTHVISNNVPCIGGDGPGEGCDPTVTRLESVLFPYTVQAADIAGGVIEATAQYTGGVAHDSPGNTAGVSANTPKQTPVVVCDDNNLCTNDVCIPTAQGPGACSFPPVTCVDNDFCTADACNPATGTCTFTPNVPCNDNDPCTTEACNPATGQCVPSTVVVCNDQNLCTRDTCNPATGTCVFTPIDITCNDNDACTNEQCNPTTGQCVFFPAIDCDDRDPCTDDRCDPTTGCVNTPNDVPGCAGLNHFQCYEIKPFAFERLTATVEDRYGTAEVTLRAPNRLCAPSDKRGEDPTAPLTPQHLASFPSRSERFRLGNQVVTNQFGTLTLDIKRRVFLMVPTAKDLFSQPPPLVTPGNHFQCYLVRRTSGSPRFEPILDVPTEDQFGPHVVDLLRPRYLCVPADKNDEDPTAPTDEDSLLCYKAKHEVRFTQQQPFMTNQFLSRRERLIRTLEFCVPTRFGAS